PIERACLEGVANIAYGRDGPPESIAHRELESLSCRVQGQKQVALNPPCMGAANRSRHHRACPGDSLSASLSCKPKTWMAGSSPAMTRELRFALLLLQRSA